MFKRVLVLLSIVLGFNSKAQCPLVYDYLGTPTTNPIFISCTGNAYALNFQSNSNWGAYTINWGDLTANNVGASYTANSIITHTYSQTTNTFQITLTIPSQNCTLTGLVVMEKPVNASIQIPTLGITQACAPKTLTFSNSSTDVSATTSFTWNFGDGTSPVVLTSTNAGQNITHPYNKGTVNCQTQVTLQAKNYCSFNNPTIANFNPIQIYDTDTAKITADRSLRCWPDNLFSFTNTSQRNCLAQGNTFQRQEYWNLGDYWGLGHDSIINWRPWPPAAPVAVAFPSLGIFNVLLKDSNLCGVSTRSMSVLIVNPPTASLAVPVGNLCQNSALTFTNASPAGYSYRWNISSSATYSNLGSGNKTFTFSTPGTYTVNLVALVNGGGAPCTDTSKAVINILASPIASFSLSPNASCNTATNVSFTDFSTGGNAWNWNFANGNTSTLQVPPNQNYTVTGLHTITLIVTASTGCAKSQTQTLLVRQSPLISFNQFTTCVGASVTFTNNSAPSGTDAINSYTWDYGDASPVFIGTNTPVHSYTAANTYSINLKASTAFCIDSLKLPVLVNLVPSASFVTSSSVGCQPLTINFTNQSSNATNYLWSFNTSPPGSSTSTNAIFTFSNTSQVVQSFTAQLNASTGAGCSNTFTRLISVQPKPVSNFTVNTNSGCSPYVTTFSNASVGASNNQWQFGDGNSSTNANPFHTYTNTTLFTQTVSAKLVVTNSFGCKDSSNLVLTVYPEALPNFSMVPQSGCSPLVVNFPSIPGVSTYTWNHGDASPIFTTTSSHSYTYINSGTSDLTLTVTLNALTTNGCSGTDTKTVAIFANPKADFVYTPTAACTPMIVNFTNTSINGVSNKWVFSNSETQTTINSITGFTNSIGGDEVSHTAKLVVISSKGCSDSIVKSLIVYQQPKAAFMPDTPACAPKLVSFSNTSKGGSTYKWNFGQGSTSNASNATNFYSASDGFTKTYSVSLLCISSNNCKDSVIVPIKINAKPVFNIVASPDSGCSPLRVVFPKQTDVVTYQWKFDNIAFGNAGGISNTFENKTTVPKVFNIELIGADINQCKDTAYKTIKVFPKPEAKYSVNPSTVYLPNQSTQFTNLSTSAASYTWSFGDGGSSKEYSPIHNYKTEGEFQTQLIITSNRGCKDTFALPEKIIALNETTITVPNAFTPSSAGSKGGYFDPLDKSNDVFYPNIKGASKYTFSVYSRWGELLFETRDANEGWDGYYKGKLCTQDVYIWKINAVFNDGKVFNKTGDLLLLR